MPKAPKQKQKLLYIAQYLMENTDERHSVSTPKLIAYLEANGIKAERKSIYDDIATLNDFGFDIVREEGPRGGYFMASRDFELAEVKLLVDVVQSSKFITTKKSRELIKKLEKQVSKYDASALQRQVVVADRNKTANENIYYSVDVIHEAMAKNSKVRFQYFEWDVTKQMKLRKDGAYYEVSPWLLTYDNENYYLIAFDHLANMIKYYRVDKMLHIEPVEDAREGKKEFDQIDVAAFSKKTFGMFAGEEKTVRLNCEEGLTGVIVDRFGQDVAIRKGENGRMVARVNVQVSPQFFGWLVGFGDKVLIESPDEVATEYKEFLAQIIGAYK